MEREAYILCLFFFFTLYLFTSTHCYAFIGAVSPINSYCSMPTVNASAAILPSIKSGLPYLLSNHYHPSHWLCPHFINHFTVSLAIPLGNYSVGTFRCLFRAIYLIASPGKQKQGDDWDRLLFLWLKEIKQNSSTQRSWNRTRAICRNGTLNFSTQVCNANSPNHSKWLSDVVRMIVQSTFIWAIYLWWETEKDIWSWSLLGVKGLTNTELCIMYM